MRGLPQWLLDALPNVKKEDRRKLKARGVSSHGEPVAERRSPRKSSYDKRKENNRKGAIEGSKRRKQQALEAAKRALRTERRRMMANGGGAMTRPPFEHGILTDLS